MSPLRYRDHAETGILAEKENPYSGKGPTNMLLSLYASKDGKGLVDTTIALDMETDEVLGYGD
jgi:hypothetical protein